MRQSANKDILPKSEMGGGFNRSIGDIRLLLDHLIGRPSSVGGRVSA
jgi:hypothetical protein